MAKQQGARSAGGNGSSNGAAGGKLKLLTADEILAFDDVQMEDVVVPMWGGKAVTMRGLTARERDDYEASLIQTTPSGQQRMRLSGARERLVAKCAIDRATGERLFTDEQAALIGQKSGRAIEILFDAARKLSGLTKEDVETLVGNSEAAPSATS
jgi:hypothetical protein